MPISPFKRYITHNQIDTSYYYNATPGAVQRDVKAGLRVLAALRTLKKAHAKAAEGATRDPGAAAAAFEAAYRAQLIEIQSCLGDPGYGPVASLDTETADLNRMDRVKRLAAENQSKNRDMQEDMKPAE